jgi:hypothetical protein
MKDSGWGMTGSVTSGKVRKANFLPRKNAKSQEGKDGREKKENGAAGYLVATTVKQTGLLGHSLRSIISGNDAHDPDRKNWQPQAL